ncbi:hypothetical protein C2E20_0236 [Micractinium conductrix]|uniref:HP domain-containing protein n=1 Tax=Micractinium conductrix TaxID=554055 RepID=A0A2P6VRA6_9CHLO|nr:hypothetical protein C2E20_0236 [Micractinium conductrix]|eukprot:PSC76628.1 hypothetical protein C2E20_0236 [Micractinium conductrix]
MSVQVWFFTESGTAAQSVPPEETGRFSSDKAYVVVAPPSDGEGQQRLFLWAGDDASKETKSTAAKHAGELMKTLDASYLRQQQGQEGAEFKQLFEAFAVVPVAPDPASEAVPPQVGGPDAASAPASAAPTPGATAGEEHDGEEEEEEGHGEEGGGGAGGEGKKKKKRRNKKKGHGGSAGQEAPAVATPAEPAPLAPAAASPTPASPISASPLAANPVSPRSALHAEAKPFTPTKPLSPAAAPPPASPAAKATPAGKAAKPAANASPPAAKAATPAAKASPPAPSPAKASTPAAAKASPVPTAAAAAREQPAAETTPAKPASPAQPSVEAEPGSTSVSKAKQQLAGKLSGSLTDPLHEKQGQKQAPKQQQKEQQKEQQQQPQQQKAGSPPTNGAKPKSTFMADSAKAWGGVAGGAAAPPAAAEAKVKPGEKEFSFEELKALRADSGIDMTRKEEYLPDAEFEKVFGKNRAAFNAQPAWRRQLQKKDVSLW